MTLFEKVNLQRQRLWDHPFAKTMRDNDLPALARLSPIPHMTYFIMGFKDILFDLQDLQSEDPIQKAVNEHCQEDNGHWKWFLNDLERLNLPENFLKGKTWDLIATMWSDDHWPTRNTVYNAIHLGRQARSSRLRFIMLEVIEAIFSVYAESINVLVKQMDMWETFEFFGRVHYEAENDHSSGSWLDGRKTKLESVEGMTNDEKKFAEIIIQEMFNDFTSMFSQWYKVQERNMAVTQGKACA